MVARSLTRSLAPASVPLLATASLSLTFTSSGSAASLTGDSVPASKAPTLASCLTVASPPFLQRRRQLPCFPFLGRKKLAVPLSFPLPTKKKRERSPSPPLLQAIKRSSEPAATRQERGCLLPVCYILPGKHEGREKAVASYVRVAPCSLQQQQRQQHLDPASGDCRRPFLSGDRRLPENPLPSSTLSCASLSAN